MTIGGHLRTIAAVAALVCVAAACTSDPQETTATTTAPAGDGTATGDSGAGTDDSDTDDSGTDGTDGDAGSDEPIRIAFIGADFGALSEIGLAPDLGDQEATARAVVEEINDSGGIAGRPIELRVRLVDGVAGPEAGEAACIEATQDFDAFIVLTAAAVSRNTTRCAAVANETIVLSATGLDDGVYEEADGRLFTLGTHISMGTYRQYEAWAQLMDEEGELDGATIGVVTSDVSPEFVMAAENALIPELESLGHEVAVNAVLPCPEGDTDCAQHEAAVQRMKDAGVDFVFMAAGTLSGATFVQAAKNLDFAPTWGANGNQVTDTVAQFYDGVKDWWDGAIGVSTIFAEADDITDTARDCNEIVERRAGEVYEPGSDAFGFSAMNCIFFLIIQQAAEAVDGPLDQASFIEAMEGLGEIPVNAGPPTSIGPDKHDAGDYVFLSDFDAELVEFVQRDGEPVKVDG